MSLPEGFEKLGFLSKGIANSVADNRGRSSDWFNLASDLNIAMMAATASSMELAKTNAFSPLAISVRIQMRSCGLFQAVSLLAERGMVAESRLPTRSLVEAAICIAALNNSPDEFITLLRNDSEASRKRQATFVLQTNLLDDEAAQKKLGETIEKIGKLPLLNLREIAKLGPLEKYYLVYQRLSDDSCHLTARALDKHVNRAPENKGWQYQWVIGDGTETEKTLYYATMATLAVGVGVSEILENHQTSAQFNELMDRFTAMPETGPI